MAYKWVDDVSSLCDLLIVAHNKARKTLTLMQHHSLCDDLAFCANGCACWQKCTDHRWHTNGSMMWAHLCDLLIVAHNETKKHSHWCSTTVFVMIWHFVQTDAAARINAVTTDGTQMGQWCELSWVICSLWLIMKPEKCSHLCSITAFVMNFHFVQMGVPAGRNAMTTDGI